MPEELPPPEYRGGSSLCAAVRAVPEPGVTCNREAGAVRLQESAPRAHHKHNAVSIHKLLKFMLLFGCVQSIGFKVGEIR